jgi:hypothetical protein
MADPDKEMTMTRTIRTRSHPALLIAATLLAAGSAAVVGDGAFGHHANTVVDVPYIHQGSGPQLRGLTPVDREAAQRLAELRAQRVADIQCIGPVYPARPC